MLTDKANAICILKILQEYSDEDHILQMRDLISHMEGIYGLSPDRRTVYSAVELLQDLGYDTIVLARELSLREMEHIGEGTIAAFCHEGTIQTVFNYVIGGKVNVFPARVDNGSVSVVEWDGKMWHVNAWNRLPGPLAGAYTKPDD